MKLIAVRRAFREPSVTRINRLRNACTRGFSDMMLLHMMRCGRRLIVHRSDGLSSCCFKVAMHVLVMRVKERG